MAVTDRLLPQIYLNKDGDKPGMGGGGGGDTKT